MHLHDTLHIVASKMEPSITTIMQQKQQFHKSHCSHVTELRKNGNISYKRDFSYACFYNTQILRSAVSEKIANLAQYPKRLGTALC